MKINGKLIETFTTPPQEEGYFLYQSVYHDRVDLLHVVLIPGGFRYGLWMDSYYAVANHNGHRITKYTGQFAKITI